MTASIGCRKLDGNLEECIEGNWATELYQLTGETGSYRYMAPEVYRHEPYNSAVRPARSLPQSCSQPMPQPACKGRSRHAKWPVHLL